MRTAEILGDFIHRLREKHGADAVLELHVPSAVMDDLMRDSEERSLRPIPGVTWTEATFMGVSIKVRRKKP